MTDARSDIRAAVRRLISAIQETAIEVTVQRADIEVLLAVNASRLQAPTGPRLHPEQR